MHNSTWLVAFALTPWLACQIPPAPKPTADLHAEFHRILSDNVRDERVDYLKIRDQHFQQLTTYLDRLDRTELSTLTRNDQLALLINLYNATMIRVVAERYVVGWTPEQDKFRVFDEQLVRLGGKQLSLNDLEHQRIRKGFGDARIHVALVCAARSCPPLLPSAYRGDDLDKVLDAKMRAFVADPFRNKIGKQEVELSKLLEWYRDDFGKSEAKLLHYLSKFADQDLAGRKISYRDYSWQTNILQPEGQWVTTKSDQQPHKVLKKDGDELLLRRPFGKGETTVAAADTTPFRIDN